MILLKEDAEYGIVDHDFTFVVFYHKNFILHLKYIDFEGPISVTGVLPLLK